MAQRKTPIALFTYNRPEHVERVLETLARAARLDECHLYIYCDGPRQAEHTDAVKASRSVVRDWASGRPSQVEVIERTENWGLARSVVGGVTDLCAEYGRVIVLEDDLALSPDFLDYMLQALDRYEYETRVYQISGYMYPIELPSQPDAFFMPLTTTWGWATWKRGWQIFDWDISESHKKLRIPELRQRFNLDDNYPYAEMLEQRLANQVDSWGILYWWAVFQAGGLVLHPRRSLVWNSGFDGSGVNCERESDFGRGSLREFASPRLSQPIVWPEEIESNQSAFEKVKSFLGTQNQIQNRSLLARLRRKVAHRLSRLAS